MKTTRYICYILCSLLAVASTACDKDVHDDEYPLPEGHGAMITGLQSDKEVRDIHLFLFGERGTTVLRDDYTAPRELASTCLPVRSGTYTLVVVANMTDEGLPTQTTVADLAEWLREHAAAYPGMLTASAQAEVEAGEVKRLLLELREGTGGIALSTVRLHLTLPEPDMPAYTSTRAKDGESTPLRLVAEAYRKGTDVRVHRHIQLCEEQADGTYLAGLSLLPGDYDLRLWADLATDGTTDGRYYDTDDLTAVTVRTENYAANGQTDEKDACYATLSATVSGDRQGMSVELTRPFARYRLVATDVQGYLNLIAGGDDLPPIGELDVRGTYEGFFPTGFDVTTGKPNDALNTGIHYTAAPVAATGYPEAEARQVGADFVLTNGGESFVTVTIQMIDPRTGKAISTLTGIEIPYRRGHLTTVTGHFLTAGRTTGGVQVDNDSENDVTIDF